MYMIKTVYLLFYFFFTEVKTRYQRNKAMHHNTKFIFWSICLLPLSNPSFLTRKNIKCTPPSPSHFFFLAIPSLLQIFLTTFSEFSLNSCFLLSSSNFNSFSASQKYHLSCNDLLIRWSLHFPKIQRFLWSQFFALFFTLKYRPSQR